MKKILFVIPNFQINGFTSSLLALIENLKETNFEPYIYALSHDGELQNRFQKKSLLPESIFLSAYYKDFNNEINPIRIIFTCLIKIIKRVSILLKIDIIPILNIYLSRKISPNIYDTIIAFSEGEITHICSSLPCHNKIAWIHCDISKIKSFNESLGSLEKIYQSYSKIICVSEYTKAIFISFFPMFLNKTFSLHNFLNENLILQLSNNNNICEECFNKYKSTKIISIGRICDVKQFYLIPKIANELKRTGLIFRWYIIGYGTNYEIDKIIKNICDNNVKDIVFYLGGKPNPYSYMKNSSLLVSTSSSEACPMVFNEAKLLNIPIVSSDFGSSYEFIKENGRICSISNMPKVIKETIDQKESKVNYFSSENKIILEQLKYIIEN